MTINKTEASVKNGIKILKKAIKSKGKISLSEACRQSDRGRNYVSDIKLRIQDNRKKKNISKELFQEFNTLMKQYSN